MGRRRGRVPSRIIPRGAGAASGASRRRRIRAARTGAGEVEKCFVGAPIGVSATSARNNNNEFQAEIWCASSPTQRFARAMACTARGVAVAPRLRAPERPVFDRGSARGVAGSERARVPRRSCRSAILSSSREPRGASARASATGGEAPPKPARTVGEDPPLPTTRATRGATRLPRRRPPRTARRTASRPARTARGRRASCRFRRSPPRTRASTRSSASPSAGAPARITTWTSSTISSPPSASRAATPRDCAAPSSTRTRSLGRRRHEKIPEHVRVRRPGDWIRPRHLRRRLQRHDMGRRREPELAGLRHRARHGRAPRGQAPARGHRQRLALRRARGRRPVPLRRVRGRPGWNHGDGVQTRRLLAANERRSESSESSESSGGVDRAGRHLRTETESGGRPGRRRDATKRPER